MPISPVSGSNPYASYPQSSEGSAPGADQQKLFQQLAMQIGQSSMQQGQQGVEQAMSALKGDEEEPDEDDPDAGSI